jgi:hypothetical protein
MAAMVTPMHKATPGSFDGKPTANRAKNGADDVGSKVGLGAWAGMGVSRIAMTVL